MKIKELGKEFFNDIFSNEFIINQNWVTVINKDKLIFSLLHQKSALETYTEDKEELKNNVIATLIDKEYTFNKIANTMDLDYNPIENFNKTETFTQSTELSNTENTENTMVNGRVESGSTNTYGEKTSTEEVQNGERKETNTTNYGESTESTSTDFGTITENVTSNKGQQNSSTTNSIGSKVDTTTTDSGERINVTEMEHGQQDISDSNNLTKSMTNFPFDLDTQSLPTSTEQQKDIVNNHRINSQYTDSSTSTDSAVSDSVTASYGEQTNEISELKDAYTDTEEKVTQGRQDSSTTTNSAKTDTVTNVSNSVKDTKNLTENEHEDSVTSFVNETTDTNNGSRSESGTENRSYELHTSGNIGVTTTQQMIQSERELAMFSFSELVKNAIVSSLALGVWY